VFDREHEFGQKEENSYARDGSNVCLGRMNHEAEAEAKVFGDTLILEPWKR
jgi:hypothetical protein